MYPSPSFNNYELMVNSGSFMFILISLITDYFEGNPKYMFIFKCHLIYIRAGGGSSKINNDIPILHLK